MIRVVVSAFCIFGIAEGGRANAQEQAEEATETATVEVGWEAMPGAVSYELEFKSLDTVLPPSHFKTSQTTYKTDLSRGRYHFRIRSMAKGGSLGDWSDPVEVQAGEVEVELQQPSEGKMVKANGKTSKVRFEWAPIAGGKSYELRVWDVNESRDTAKVVRTTQTSTGVPLEVGRKYHWEVQGLTASGVNYQRKSPPFSFTLYGQKVPRPEITEVKLSEHPRIEWRTVEGATISLQVFHREIGQTKWTLIDEQNDVSQSYWRSSKPLDPGQYRIVLIAKAAMRGDSDPVSREFAIKPQHFSQ
ncbi:MAG: hypothetical protein IT288_00300 [Bdellovibrionales bacterium]|nr:hypothetical protein [Bdellovibrionales bacterium]